MQTLPLRNNMKLTPDQLDELLFYTADNLKVPYASVSAVSATHVFLGTKSVEFAYTSTRDDFIRGLTNYHKYILTSSNPDLTTSIEAISAEIRSELYTKAQSDIKSYIDHQLTNLHEPINQLINALYNNSSIITKVVDDTENLTSSLVSRIRKLPDLDKSLEKLQSTTSSLKTITTTIESLITEVQE